MSTEANQVSVSVVKQGRLASGYRKIVGEEYIKRGWLKPEDCPNGEFRDEFDDFSNLIVMHDEEQALGGMRIVHHSRLGLPHDHVIDLERLKVVATYLPCHKTVIETPTSSVAEITRVAGRIRNQTFLKNVARGLYWYGIRFNITYYLMVIDLDFFRLCDHAQIPIHPFGTPFKYDGSWTLPALTVPMEYPIAIKGVNGSDSPVLDPTNLAFGWESPEEVEEISCPEITY